MIPILSFLFPEIEAATESNKNPVFPLQGFSQSIKCLVNGINYLSYALIGKKATELNFEAGNPEELPPASNLDPTQLSSLEEVPVRFENTGNYLIEIKDRCDITYYWEVLNCTETGGWARYEDRNGEIQKIQWERNGEGKFFVSGGTSCQQFFGIEVPPIKKEKQKTVGDQLGTMSTIVVRNGQGGVSFKNGDLSSQLVEIHKVLSEIQTSLPKDTKKALSNINDSILTSVSMVNNTLQVLNNELMKLEKSLTSTINENLVKKINIIEQRLSKVGVPVLDLAKIPCQYMTFGNIPSSSEENPS